MTWIAREEIGARDSEVGMNPVVLESERAVPDVRIGVGTIPPAAHTWEVFLEGSWVNIERGRAVESRLGD